MVNSSTTEPSFVLVTETTTSLRISGGRLCSDIPFTLQVVTPPTVSHVNTADWSRKTTVLSGARSISEKPNAQHRPGLLVIYLEQRKEAKRREGPLQHQPLLERSGHASVQTSGFSLTLRNRGKGGWARDLRGRRQNCLPRYSAGVKSRSVVLGYPS